MASCKTKEEKKMYTYSSRRIVENAANPIDTGSPELWSFAAGAVQTIFAAGF